MTESVDVNRLSPPEGWTDTPHSTDDDLVIYIGPHRRRKITVNRATFQSNPEGVVLDLYAADLPYGSSDHEEQLAAWEHHEVESHLHDLSQRDV